MWYLLGLLGAGWGADKVWRWCAEKLSSVWGKSLVVKGNKDSQNTLCKIVYGILKNNIVLKRMRKENLF